MASFNKSVHKSDKELVLAAQEGSQAAFDQLFNRWFDKVWNVSKSILRDSDLATETAQETFLTAWQQLHRLEKPEAFGGWVLRSSRNTSLNTLKKEHRSTPLPSEIVGEWQDSGKQDAAGSQDRQDTTDLSSSRAQQSLVWAASAALGEKDASILDLHLRHGLTAAELAEELKLSKNNAHQRLHQLRKRLGEAVGNYLLWRDGSPLCEQLQKSVSGSKAFGQSTHKAVRNHQKSCSDCAEQRRDLVSPGQLFSAVPLFVVPPALRAEAAAGLQADGLAITADDGSSVDSSTAEDASADTPDPDASTTENAAVADDSTEAANLDAPTAEDAAADSSSLDAPTTEDAAADSSSLDAPTTENAAADSSSLDAPTTENAAIAEIPTITDDSTEAADHRYVAPEENSRSEAIESRFAPLEPSAPITEQFELIPDEEETSFAQDDPVRYSSRPPRATTPEPASGGFEMNKQLAIAAAAVLLVTTVGALLILGRDQEDVSATGAIDPPEIAITGQGTNEGPLEDSDDSPAGPVGEQTETDRLGRTGNALTPLPTSLTGEVIATSTTENSPTTTLKDGTTNATTNTTRSTTRTTIIVEKPTTTTAPKAVAVVPDVVLMPTVQGADAMRDAGLQPKVRDVTTSNERLAGHIRSTSPSAGNEVPRGSIVTVYVYTLSNK